MEMETGMMPVFIPETILVSVDRGAFQDGSAATFR